MDQLQKVKFNLGPQQTFSVAVMRRHMLELGCLYSKACVEKTPQQTMSCERKYIINENDMKVILNVIH